MASPHWLLPCCDMAGGGQPSETFCDIHSTAKTSSLENVGSGAKSLDAALPTLSVDACVFRLPTCLLYPLLYLIIYTLDTQRWNFQSRDFPSRPYRVRQRTTVTRSLSAFQKAVKRFRGAMSTLQYQQVPQNDSEKADLQHEQGLEFSTTRRPRTGTFLSSFVLSASAFVLGVVFSLSYTSLTSISRPYGRYETGFQEEKICKFEDVPRCPQQDGLTIYRYKCRLVHCSLSKCGSSRP